MEVDREIEGAGRIYERAKKWGHLPRGMTFESFLAALRRGDDPYLKSCVGEQSQLRQPWWSLSTPPDSA